MGRQCPRANQQWLQQLNRPGADQDDALADLYGVLVRGLGCALAKNPMVTEADVHEFAYEALLKILAALDSFRGECRFTTWALKIAVHTAFTELRHGRWSDLSHQKASVQRGGTDARYTRSVVPTYC